ncbi:hypothetical protein JCM3765_006915 [Sporobolomyces pararoseus]
MSNPLSSTGGYSALPSSNPLLGDESDQPYHSHESHIGPSPSYPGEPSTSSVSGTGAPISDLKPSRPVLPPLDNNPESQIAFYRSELSYVREENQKLRDKIEQLKEKEVKRLQDELSNNGLFRFFIVFFGSFFGVLVIIYLLTK